MVEPSFLGQLVNHPGSIYQANQCHGHSKKITYDDFVKEEEGFEVSPN